MARRTKTRHGAVPSTSYRIVTERFATEWAGACSDRPPRTSRRGRSGALPRFLQQRLRRIGDRTGGDRRATSRAASPLARHRCSAIGSAQMRASAVVMSDARVRAWIRGGVVGLAAIATGLVALAPACTTHQCDSSSYDYYGGRMLNPNTYETNDWNEPWISYPGNVTVTVHFPPGIGRQPLEVVGNVGMSATPNG